MFRVTCLLIRFLLSFLSLFSVCFLVILLMFLSILSFWICNFKITLMLIFIVIIFFSECLFVFNICMCYLYLCLSFFFVRPFVSLPSVIESICVFLFELRGNSNSVAPLTLSMMFHFILQSLNFFFHFFFHFILQRLKMRESWSRWS